MMSHPCSGWPVLTKVPHRVSASACCVLLLAVHPCVQLSVHALCVCPSIHTLFPVLCLFGGLSCLTIWLYVPCLSVSSLSANVCLLINPSLLIDWVKLTFLTSSDEAPSSTLSLLTTPTSAASLDPYNLSSPVALVTVPGQ
jgi:hypothetical protein